MSSENDAWRIIHVPARPPFPPDQQLTVNMVAAQIEQPKLTNTIIRRLSQIAPLEDLHHVKRVKKKCLEGGTLQLSVILFLAPENGDFDGIPCDVKDVINSCQLSPFVAKVCKYAASSTEEWVEQCKLWPTSYHPPTYNISGITGFSEEDSQSVVVNAAAIVDPLSNQVIARACDEVCYWHTPEIEVAVECGPEQVETSVSCLHPRLWVDERTHRSSSFWHPLRHAVMVAIESSAARDRRLFPDVRYEDEATQQDSSLSAAKSQGKRQKTDVAEVDTDDKHDDAHGKGDLSSRPYLCTGNDIYLVWEPCTMCAMALVHQRIRRVFYAFPNSSAGALGSVHRLQGEKSLNHHYAAFRVVVPDVAAARRRRRAALISLPPPPPPPPPPPLPPLAFSSRSVGVALSSRGLSITVPPGDPGLAAANYEAGSKRRKVAAEKSICKLPPTKNSTLVPDQPAHADSSKTATNTSKKKIVAAPKKKSRARRPVEQPAGPAVEKHATGAVQEEASLAVEEDAAQVVQEEAASVIEEDVASAVQEEAAPVIEEPASSEEQPAVRPVSSAGTVTALILE
ncbi:hypothetical protein NL676_013427 [Syzygium grande]|nr:hypothetical protein NL676_013427 [Syzygium grande]